MLKMTFERAYYKAWNSGKRLPELELIIQQDAKHAYRYARDVIKGRWPEAESTISKDACWACCYALDVIQGRWLEAEPTIAQDATIAYYYAKDVIGGSWPEAEATIKQDAKYAYGYAIHVLKCRWPEVEETIAQSEYKSRYVSLFFSEPVVTKDQCSDFEWKKAGAAGYFASRGLFEKRESLIDMMIENQNMPQC